MKSPTYILKNVYLENNLDRELMGHKKRLNGIKTKPVNPSKKINSITNLEKISQKNHLKSVEF